MSTYSDVRAGIRIGIIKALSEYTDPQVIFSHSGGSEPSESYVVVNILSIEQQGHSSNSTNVNGLNELSITASYEVFAQVSFVGSKSGEMSQSLSQRVSNNPIVLEEFRRNNLTFMRKSQIRRAPQKRDTKWVEYHNIDLTFSYNIRTQQVVDIIETVILQDEITGEIYTVPPGIVTP